MSLDLDKSNWKRVTFGEVVSNRNETVKDPKALGIDRVIAMEHLDPGELKIARWASIEDDTTFTRRVRPGQTLFGKRRAYQRKAAYAEFDAITSGDVLVFEADQTHLLPELLPFLVQSNGFYGHAVGTSAGSLSPRTNWRDLAKYELDLPPLDAQKRIADLLWSVESHRLSLRHRLGIAQLATDLLLDQVLASDGSLSRLDEVVEAIVDCVHKTAPTDEVGTARVIGTPDVRDGRINLETARPVSDETFRAWTERAVPKSGDLIFTREAPAGEVGVVPNDQRVCLGQRTVLIRPNDPDDAHLLWAVLRTPRVQASIHLRAAGSTVAHLNVADIRALLVPWPKDDLARVKVREIVVAAQECTGEVVREAESLSRLRTSLMAVLMGGAS